MAWEVRELRSDKVLNSDLQDKEKELIKMFVNCAIQERTNYNGRRLFHDGMQTGIAQTLKLLNRDDIWDIIDYEFMYHPELN